MPDTQSPGTVEKGRMKMINLKARKKPARETTVSQSADCEKMQLAIAEIAAESWRFGHALNKVMSRMDVMEAQRFSRQYGYFSSRVSRAVSSAGLNILDLTGQKYSVGLPVQAMNLEEFDEEDELIITQVIEPVIMLNNRVLKTGMVMLDRIPAF